MKILAHTLVHKALFSFSTLVTIVCITTIDKLFKCFVPVIGVYEVGFSVV